LAPFAPLFSHRVWLHAQLLLLGAMLAPGARTVTASLRALGLATERRFTNDHRVLNRATWSARQGSQILLGFLITCLMPPGATVVLGADDMVARLRWDAALYHPPGAHPKGKRGPKPTKGKRQRRLQAWAAHADTPWETVEVDWYGGQRKTLWVFSRTALWYTPGLPPVDIRSVLVCDPEGKLRMEAFFCTDLQATPVQILRWVVMRWSVEVTCEEARAHLGFETQRQWSDQAIARTTPILLALFSLVTVLALKLSGDGQIPIAVTAWYHKGEPTFSDCLTLGRRHLWRARYVVNSPPEGECMQFPREALDLLIHGVPLAA
jgi:hypothetical protein